MRIAVVSTPYLRWGWGGSEELWATMADAALRDGHEVAASVYRVPSMPPKLRALEERGLRVQRRPSQSLLRRRKVGLLVARYRLSPFRRLFRSKPDVVFVNLGSPDQCVKRSDLLWDLSEARLPYVVVVHLVHDWVFPSEQERDLMAGFFGRAARVLFVSEASRKTVERHLGRALPNAAIVRNPVNIADLSPVPWPAGGPVRLASVARLTVGDKGQDLLLEALGSPAWRCRDWRLRLYGRGLDEPYLRALARHFGIAERVEFRGQVDDVRGIWADNHLCVLPSRAEGAPLALIEAMLCGRPAAATDVGGNAEWLTDQRTGFIAEAATAQSFGAALEHAWSARAGWCEMGLRAHESALARYDPAPGRTLLDIVVRAAGDSRACAGAPAR